MVNIARVLFGLNKKQNIAELIEKIPVSFEPQAKKKVSLEKQIQEEE